MEITFVKTSPTQNMTILVTSHVPQEVHLDVAQRMMAYDSVHAEQVGYVTKTRDPRADAALCMMAGEFCGNATLSLGALLMAEEAVGQKKEMFLEVSGAKDLVRCTMTKGETDYFGVVEMPLPRKIEQKLFPVGTGAQAFPVVYFEGIAHVIVPTSLWAGEDFRNKGEEAARLWADRLPSVFGILFWEEETKTMTPLVSVQRSSLVWERGCGSGTAAIGAYLAMKAGEDISLECVEPGGCMEVSVTMMAGAVSAIYLGGHVSIVAKGTAYL